MRANDRVLSILLAALLALPLAAVANGGHDHHHHAGHEDPVEHDDHDDHAHHAHEHDPPEDGPWSYSERDNPEPWPREQHWTMVPVPQFGHMYVSAENLDPDLVCAAILDNPRFMVDRATRERCDGEADHRHDEANDRDAIEDHHDHHHH